MGKMGEQLFFKLRPIASGNHGHFDDAEKVMQQSPPFRHQETICFRQVCRPDRKQSAFSRSFHLEFLLLMLPGYAVVNYSGIAISNKFTAPRG